VGSYRFVLSGGVGLAGFLAADLAWFAGGGLAAGTGHVEHVEGGLYDRHAGLLGIGVSEVDEDGLQGVR
jgi:hypothetical protein